LQDTLRGTGRFNEAQPLLADNGSVNRIRPLATSLAVILTVAFCLRAGYLWSYQAERPHQALGIIPFLFEPGNIAASLASGKGFSSPFRVETGPTAWLTPVYPFLLAGVFRIFGADTFASFMTAAGLNVLFSTLTIVPLWFAARRMGGIGAAAGPWLWAVFPNAIRLPVESMWDSSLAALLAAGILWATLELPDSRRVWDWYAYGLLWGLALMTSPALLSVLPFLLGWAAWRSRRFAWAALAVGATILCCVPWTIRNYRVFHSFVPLRSVVGLTLWLGNHDQSRGEWPGRLHPIDNSGERDRYIELGEIGYMTEKKDEALQFMTEHPWAEARACWYRFVVIWTGGSAHPLDDFLNSDSWPFRGILLFNLLGSIGALAGLVILFRGRNRYAFPLAVFPVIFPIIYYITLASARYRLPMDAAILLLCAVALHRCGGLTARRRSGG